VEKSSNLKQTTTTDSKFYFFMDFINSILFIFIRYNKISEKCQEEIKTFTSRLSFVRRIIVGNIVLFCFSI